MVDDQNAVAAATHSKLRSEGADAGQPLRHLVEHCLLNASRYEAMQMDDDAVAW